MPASSQEQVEHRRDQRASLFSNGSYVDKGKKLEKDKYPGMSVVARKVSKRPAARQRR